MSVKEFFKESHFAVSSPLGTDFDNLITVEEDTLLDEVLLLFARKPVQSLTVFSLKRKAFVAMLDRMDVLCYLLYAAFTGDDLGGDKLKADAMSYAHKASRGEPVEEGDTKELHWRLQKFYSASVTTVLSASTDKKSERIYGGEPFLRALQRMLYNNLCRIPVVSPGGNVHKVISQTDVVHFIHQNRAQLRDPELNSCVSDLGLGQCDTDLAVRVDDPIYRAFEMMCQQQSSGVGVIDSERRLKETVTLSDLRIESKEVSWLTDLWLPAMEFMSKRRSSMGWSSEHQLITCSPSDKLETVIARMSEFRVHHIFVVDDPRTMKFMGIVCPGDILRALLLDDEHKSICRQK